MKRAGRLFVLSAIWVVGLAFVFDYLLAVRVAPAAVALFVACLVLTLPVAQRWIRMIPGLRSEASRRGIFLGLLALALALLVAGNRTSVERHPLALVGATVISGLGDRPAIPDGVVLVDERGVITTVGSRADVVIPEGVEVMDVSGKFVMPGLINAHDHLMMIGARDPFEPADMSNYAGSSPLRGIGEWFLGTYVGHRLIESAMEGNAQRALRGGVTTVRELSTVGFLDVTLRNRIDRGERIGPRIVAAGQSICTTGGHTYQIGTVIDGPDEARRAVRLAVKHHVDLIKIANTGGVADSHRFGEAGELQMTPDEIRAVVDEAHRKNLLVAAHAESSEGMLEALRAGVDSVEHGAPMSEEAVALFLDNPNALRGYTTLHPTLSVLAGGIVAYDLERGSRADVMHANADLVRGRMVQGFKDAIAAGVLVGVGTDAGVVAHDQVWKELQLFVDLGGVSPEEAIRMGTSQTALSIGLENEIGSIEAGKSADLLVLDQDPRIDLSALASPSVVIARGFVYPGQ